MNNATTRRGRASAHRVTNASPAWAEPLRDAQARANARRVAGSDAAITTWVRLLMRDQSHRDATGSHADAPNR
jgi:hypothetical protein